MDMAESLAGWLAAWNDENFFFDSGLNPIGIRVQPQPFRTGAFTHTSNRWDDGEDTGEPVVNEYGEEVDGVSVLRIASPSEDDVATALALADGYVGPHMGILIGEDAEYGVDEDEIILTGDVECILVIR